MQGEHFDINHDGEFTLLRIPQALEESAMLHLQATIEPVRGKPCTTWITEVVLSGGWLDDAVSIHVRAARKTLSGNETDVPFSIRIVRPGSATQRPWTPLGDFPDEAEELSQAEARRSGVAVTLSKTQWKRRHYGPHSRGENIAGLFKLSIRDPRSQTQAAEIDVRQNLPGQEFLNVVVRHLNRLARSDVGGLLGLDEHSEALKEVTEECKAWGGKENWMRRGRRGRAQSSLTREAVVGDGLDVIRSSATWE